MGSSERSSRALRGLDLCRPRSDALVQATELRRVLRVAIYAAVGVRHTELPITPERVLRALREQRGEGSRSRLTAGVHVR